MNSKRILPNTLIVTPTLGDRETIERTVQFVREIGGDRVHHLIIAPAKTIPDLTAKFPHCECIAEEGKKGVYAAVNQGLRRATNEISLLGYINDDDYWLPNFHKLFDALDNYESVDIAYGRALFVDEANMPLFESTSTSRYFAFNSLLAHSVPLITQPATLFRRSLFEQLGGFDETFKLFADTEFWLRAIVAEKKLHYVNDACAAYMLQKGLLLSSLEASESERKRVLTKHGIKRSTSSYLEFARFKLSNVSHYIRRVLYHRSARVKSYSG